MTPAMIRLQEKLGKGPSVIGVHVGATFVAAVQVVSYQGRPTVIKTAMELVQRDKGDAGEPAIVSALRIALSRFFLRRASIVCVVADPQVFVRAIAAPPMPITEIEPAIRLAVRNLFPFALDEAILDFRVVNKISQRGMERFQILVAACPRAVIDRYQMWFRDSWAKGGVPAGRAGKTREEMPTIARIRVANYIPPAIALENLLGRSLTLADETVAVIDLGEMSSELNIYKSKHLVFSHKLTVTRLDITKSMTGTLYSDTGKTELSWDEAEAIIDANGIPREDERALIGDKITAQQILSLIGPKLEQLAAEIRRALDYYRGEHQDNKVDRVFLFGKASRLKRLDEFLNVELGLTVRCGNPLEAIALLDPSLVAGPDVQRSALALGAALADTKGINLMPKKFPAEKKRLMERRVLETLAVITAAVVVVMYGTFQYRIRGYRDHLRHQNAEFTSQLKEVRENIAVNRLLEQRPPGGEILRLFSNTPANIYLNELNLHDNQLHIKGLVVEEGTDSRLILSRFIAGLQGGVFKDVRLVSSRENQQDGHKFEFEIVSDLAAGK